MTLAEVIDTRPGDRLQGPQGWRGVVMRSSEKGVHVAWDGDRVPERVVRFSDPEWNDVSKRADEL